jgi:hypothetical protein
MEISSQSPVIDTRPFLPSAQDSPYAMAEAQRNDFANSINTALQTKGIRALIVKSQPGVYPPRLDVTSWRTVRDQGTELEYSRASLSITVAAKPWQVHPFAYSVQIVKNNKTFSRELYDLTPQACADAALFSVELAPRPMWVPTEIDKAFSKIGNAFIILLSALLPIPGNPLDDNPFRRDSRGDYSFSPHWLLYGIGFLGLCTVAVDDISVGAKFIAVITSMIFFIGGFIWKRKCKHIVTVIKQPQTNPRNLVLMDSWGASIPDMGKCFNQLVQRIEQSLSNLDPTLELSWETYQYHTPNGFEERPRLVLSKQQAVVHIHLHPFASDVFVGWQSYLNHARWAETTAVSTKFSLFSKTQTDFRELVVDSYRPTALDIVELSALSELTHRRLVIVVQTLMREQEIDADIDFAIIRGSRESVLGNKDTEPKRGGWKRFLG